MRDLILGFIPGEQVVFAEACDFEYYLATLAEFKVGYDVKVYAFCLMTNHVHFFIVQPTEGVAAGLGRLMKRLAGRQTRYVNRLREKGADLFLEASAPGAYRCRQSGAGAGGEERAVPLPAGRLALARPAIFSRQGLAV